MTMKTAVDKRNNQKVTVEDIQTVIILATGAPGTNQEHHSSFKYYFTFNMIQPSFPSNSDEKTGLTETILESQSIFGTIQAKNATIKILKIQISFFI